MKKIFKNKYFIPFVFGAISCFAFAPFHFFIAAIISISAFFILLEKPNFKSPNSKKEIFLTSFSYGFGYFLFQIYWIAISLLVDASSFAWLIPFALTLIPAVLALYFAFLAISYKAFIERFLFNKYYQKALVFAIFWVIFEFLRSNLFTGFPWNLLGYIWLFNIHFAQLASLVGIYGLSFFAVLICILPVLIILYFSNKINKELELFGKFDKIFTVSLVILFFANGIYGYFRINDKNLVIDNNVKLRLVQGNIKQEMKWDMEEKYRNFLKHINLSNSTNSDDVSAVIWSETAAPYAINDNFPVIEKLRLAAPRNGILITGGLKTSYSKYYENEIEEVFNSVFVINKQGVESSYDKHHLVPFGEYIPLQKYLPFIGKITDGAIGFSSGDGSKTILTNDFSFSPLVCYEVIFSDKTIDRKNVPDLLVNVTNDAWFGRSSGPYQHLDMAKMRSIEYGISMARVANTGITAFIDPYGRVVNRVNLNQEGVFDVFLIKKLDQTFYRNYGYIGLAILIAAIIVILYFFRNDFRQSDTNR